LPKARFALEQGPSSLWPKPASARQDYRSQEENSLDWELRRIPYISGPREDLKNCSGILTDALLDFGSAGCFCCRHSGLFRKFPGGGSVFLTPFTHTDRQSKRPGRQYGCARALAVVRARRPGNMMCSGRPAKGAAGFARGGQPRGLAAEVSAGCSCTYGAGDQY